MSSVSNGSSTHKIRSSFRQILDDRKYAESKMLLVTFGVDKQVCVKSTPFDTKHDHLFDGSYLIIFNKTTVYVECVSWILLTQKIWSSSTDVLADRKRVKWTSSKMHTVFPTTEFTTTSTGYGLRKTCHLGRKKTERRKSKRRDSLYIHGC